MTTVPAAGTGAFRALVRDYATWVFIAALALAFTPYLVPVWSADDLARRGPYYLDVLLVCASIIACVAGRSTVRSAYARRFWDLMGIAFVFCLASRLPDTSGAGLGWDMTADILGLGFFFFALAALAIQPDQARGCMSLSRRIQVVAAATSLVGLIVYFTVIPVALNPEEYMSWVPHAVVTILLDLCLIIATARSLRRARSSVWSPVYRLLCLAWVLWLCTDLLNSAAQVGLWSVALGTPIDLIWAIPYVPLLLAARLGHHAPAAGLLPEGAADSEERSSRPVLIYAALFLLMHVVMTGTGGLSAELYVIRAWTAVVFCTKLGLLAIAYERALAQENRLLRDARESAVAEGERAQMLTELGEAQRLESLGVLAGGVAHDFNNILQSILGNVDLLSSTLERDSASMQHMDGIEGAARRAADLVAQILTYAGQGPTERAPVDLNEITRGILQLVPLPLQNLADIRMELDEHPVTVYADPTQLRQVVLNLVVNACEALQENGVVTISTHRVGAPPGSGIFESNGESGANGGSAASGPPTRRAVLEVRDTGVGMDVETRARIFEPFFTTKSGGRGLGLATTWGIVRGHSGEIDVESHPGVGTTITVAFPLTDAAPSPPVARPLEQRRSANGETVLVVDDEPGVASFVQTALQGKGYSVLIAGDGRSGLRVLAEHAEVALIFLDLTMPGMEAPDVMREIRDIRPDVPVVVVTGFDRDTAIPKLRQYQPEAFLYKPFRLDDLLSVTQRVLTGKVRGG